MATNTAINEGIRINFLTFGDRNFETSGTVQYASNFSDKDGGLSWVDGANYTVGQNLPFDVGGVSYSKTAVALLRRYWDQNWIKPIV